MNRILTRAIRPLTLLAGLAGVFAAGLVFDTPQKQFLTFANQRDVIWQASIPGILAVGMTAVILTGGIDLSVGSILSLCTVVCAMLLMHPDGAEPGRAHVLTLAAVAILLLAAGAVALTRRRRAAAPAHAGTAGTLILALLPFLAAMNLPAAPAFGLAGVLLAVPAVGAACGLVNGWVLARTRLQPFIVTLAMMVAAVGLAKYVAGRGGQVHSILYQSADDPNGAPASFGSLQTNVLTIGSETLPNGRVRDLKLIPVPGLFFLGSVVLGALLLQRLPVGRHIYAIGGNEEAARLAGLPVAGVKMFVYTLSGALAGLAAVLYCSQYTQGKADAGAMKELDAIAAVVIGGTSLMGGRGSIAGTLVGVLIFGYLSNILQLHAVSSEIQDIVKGVIIVSAAAVQSGLAVRLTR